MNKFQIFSDGRAAGSAPVSGSDFVTKDYLSESIALETTRSIEAIEVNGTASVVTNKTASISLEFPSGSDVAVLPVDNSTYDSETGVWNLGTTFVTEVSAALADGKAVYLAVTNMDGTVYPALTLNMGTLYGFGGITMPGDPSVAHTWQLQTSTGILSYVTASLQNHIPGLQTWFSQYSGSLVETEQWVTENKNTLISASQWVTENSASLETLSSSITAVILDNEEVVAAALNDLDGRVISLSSSLQSLSSSIVSDTDLTALSASLSGAIVSSSAATNARLDTLVSGSASEAIDTFNEIVAFLDNIEDTETLEGIIAGIGTSITASANAVRAEVSASYATTASLESLSSSVASTLGTYATTSSLEALSSSITTVILNNEEVTAAALNELDGRVTGLSSSLQTLSASVAANSASVTQADLTALSASVEATYAKSQDIPDVSGFEQSSSIAAAYQPKGEYLTSQDIADLATNQSVQALSASVASIIGLPAITSADDGKIPVVVSGSWSLTLPITVYNGSSLPDNNTGTDGDLYLQTS